MRAHAGILFLYFAAAITCATAEPDRAQGLSVHLLPDRVAQIDGHSGGFTVASEIYPDPAKFVGYFRTLSAATQENGNWVVTTHPNAYCAVEHEKLRALVTLCQEQKIPIFTCRSSDLPSGWTRAEVPSGWNDSSDAH